MKFQNRTNSHFQGHITLQTVNKKLCQEDVHLILIKCTNILCKAIKTLEKLDSTNFWTLSLHDMTRTAMKRASASYKSGA